MSSQVKYNIPHRTVRDLSVFEGHIRYPNGHKDSIITEFYSVYQKNPLKICICAKNVVIL